MKITNHKLEVNDFITYKQTPNIDGPFPKGLPDMIIIHYTAAPSMSSAVNWLTNKKARASAHVVVGRDGKIVQLAPFNRITWHAGESKWQKRVRLNNFSIGIEIDNCGLLEKVKTNVYRCGNNGPIIDKKDILFAKHKNTKKDGAWHKYTLEQIDRVYELCASLCEVYGIKFILGHEEIAPMRKSDPGPAFPLEDLRKEILGKEKTARIKPETPTEGVVIKSSPLFSEADPKSSVLYKSIKENTQVKISAEKNDFYKISAPLLGYIWKAYTKLDNTDSPVDGSWMKMN